MFSKFCYAFITLFVLNINSTSFALHNYCDEDFKNEKIIEANERLIIEDNKLAIENVMTDFNEEIDDTFNLIKEEIIEEPPFNVRKGNSYYGYNKLKDEEKGNEMQSLYSSFYAYCESFMNSEEDLIKDSKNHYVIASINFEELNLSSLEALSVWKVFYIENPAYYWLSNSVVISKDNIVHLVIDEMYASSLVRKKIDKDIKNMENDCFSLILPTMSNVEKYRIIHDYIVTQINYAYIENTNIPEYSIWAHSIVGVSSYGKGVCESYSKTYMYLCLKQGLDNIIVTGQVEGNIAHTWNYIKVDESWYSCDPTWDDTEIDNLLDYTFFGMSEKKVSYDHYQDDSDEYGINYLYSLPKLSDNNLIIR